MSINKQALCWYAFAALCVLAPIFDWFHDLRAWLNGPVPMWSFLLLAALAIMGLQGLERRIAALEGRSTHAEHAPNT